MAARRPGTERLRDTEPGVPSVPVARQDRLLVNQLLGNLPEPQHGFILQAADVEFDTPDTATLSFECPTREWFDKIDRFLRVDEYPSAVMDQTGGKALHLVPTGEPDPPARFPARVSIPVRYIDDPGPVEIT